MIDKQLLILDIDESLVHSASDPLRLDFDFKLFTYNVTKRPFLDEFIQYIFEWFDIAIWTAATDDYAQTMIQLLIPVPEKIRFIWSRKRCTFRYDYANGDYYWIKDLKKVKRLGYKLEKILVVEDDGRSLQRSYGNLILMKAYDGQSDDNELQLLIRYLDWIRHQDNVRKIEKRYWRDAVRNKVITTK